MPAYVVETWHKMNEATQNEATDMMVSLLRKQQGKPVPNLPQGIRPLSAEQLYSMIDHGLEQANRGEVQSLEDVIAEVDEEFGL